METADERLALAVSNAREGRLELTPSYFRMEELAGVFLPFVSGLGRLPSVNLAFVPQHE